mgnify:CR=1 FL=1
MSIAFINTPAISAIARLNSVVPLSAASGLVGVNKVNGIVNTPAGFSNAYSIDLNGSSQYVLLGNQNGTDINPTSTKIATNGYSFSAWVYLDSLSGNSQIFSLGTSGTQNYGGLNFLINGGGRIVFHVFGLNGSTPGSGSNNRNSAVTALNTISTGNWVHVVAVIPNMTRTNWKIYLNGVSQSLTLSGNVNVNLNYNTNSQIGVWARGSNQNYLNGEINNASIWDGTLNQTNITALYNSGAPIDLSTNSGNYTLSSNLIGWWRFNEGTGTSYSDSADGEFDGSGVNTPGWSTNVPT